MTELTPGEEALMRHLWKLDKFYVKDILETFPEPKPHPNTISTFLKSLVQKGFLQTEKTGRIFQYSTVHSAESYRKSCLRHFLEKYYHRDADLLVLDLVKEDLVSLHLEVHTRKGKKKKKK